MSDKKSFILRINPDTFQALEKWADDEFRSVNGQIEFLLHEAIAKAGRKTSLAAAKKKAEPKDAKGKDRT